MTTSRLTTTFKLLREKQACVDGYKKLASHLGGVKKYGRETPIALLTVLESNGLADTLWCLRATAEPQEAMRIAQAFAVECAERALPIFERRYPDDKRPRQAIETARDYLSGKITRDDLIAAYAAAAATASAAYAYATASAAYVTAAAAAASAAYAAADAATASAAYAYDADDAAADAANAAANAYDAYAAYDARQKEREEQTAILRRLLTEEELP